MALAFEECASRRCHVRLPSIVRLYQHVALFGTKIKAGLFLPAFLAVACLGILLVRDHGAIARTPLPGEARPPTEPKASAPAVKESLELIVKPMKAVFAEMEPLVFTVTLTNTSDKSFMLFESGYFWDWKIRFGEWQVVHLPEVKRAYPPSKMLERGKSIQTTVVLDNTKDLEFHLAWKENPLVQVPPVRFLPVGRYPLVIDVTFAEDIRRERLKDYTFAHWTGAITTNPVIVEIAPKK